MVKNLTFTRNVLKDKDDKPITWRGSKIIQIKPHFKKTINRNDMIKSIDKINNDLKTKKFNGSMLVSIHDPNTGKWASGDFTKIITQKPSIPQTFIDSSGKVEDVDDEYEEPDKYDDFRIYITENDIAYNDEDDEPEVLEPQIMASEKINKSLGKLIGGSLDNEKAYFTKGISNDESKIITWDYVKKSKKLLMDYVKDDVLYMNRPSNELYDIISRPKTSGYLVVQRIDEPHDKRSLIDYHFDYLKIAEELKIETCGNINLYKTGSIKKTALNFFYEQNKDKLKGEPIGSKEAKFINYASIGALINYQQYKGNCYGYDVHSFYPSIVYNKSFRIPIKCGTFKKINITTPITCNFTYGIYRCTVEGNINKFLFRSNKNNYYTSYDLNRAIKLGYTVKYVINDEDNALIYGKNDYVNSNDMFKDYIDFLYMFKEKGIKGAKLLLNILLGALCASNTFQINNEHGDINNDREVLSIFPDGDKTIFKISKSYQMFQTTYARMKPFLYAKGRELIGMFYENQIEDVVKVNTDGFMLKNPLVNIKLGDKMGQLGTDDKYTGNFNIINNQNIMRF
jgi:hypothetical protein